MTDPDLRRHNHSLQLRQQIGHNPYGIHAEGWVLHGNTIEFYAAIIAGDGEPPVGIYLVLADYGRADTDAVAVAVQRQIIANADRWNNKAESA